MYKKVNKIPGYLRNFAKRGKKIGWINMLRELFHYNQFYYSLLKKNGVSTSSKTILYHTAFYAKVVHLFSDISKEELLKIIPRSVTHGIYEKLQINRQDITYDKHNMYARMHQNSISIPHLFVVTDSQSQCLIENTTFTELTNNVTNQRILAKPRFANGGKGIHLLSPQDSILPNYIYQSFAYNHPDIIDLQGSDYCGTIRYVVYQQGEKNLLPVAASIQLNGGKITDHMINGGSISASIDLTNGKLSSLGLDHQGKLYENNPLSGKKIRGFQIPFWKELLALVEKTCYVYPELPLIAFDIAITEAGPVLLEINAGCGTVAAQFDQGWLEHPFVTDHYMM